MFPIINSDDGFYHALDFFKITLKILLAKKVLTLEEYGVIEDAINNMQDGELTSNLYVYIEEALNRISEV